MTVLYPPFFLKECITCGCNAGAATTSAGLLKLENLRSWNSSRPMKNMTTEKKAILWPCSVPD